MRRSKAVALGMTVVVATALAGCADDGLQVSDGSWSTEEVSAAAQEADTVGICVDPQTEQRLEDAQCSTDDLVEGEDTRQVHHSGMGIWYWMMVGQMLPRIGARATGGTYRTPSGSSFVAGGAGAGGTRLSKSSVSSAAKSGGTVARGGFGGSGAKAGS